MDAVLATGTLILIAAITPGPNNFIVIDAAMNGGIYRVLAAIGGVLVGSLILLVLVHTGLERLLLDAPLVVSGLRLLCACYLVWLGVTLALSSSTGARRSRFEPRSLPAIAAFQLANPKAWALVVTATGAMSAAGGGLPALVLLVVSITGACLGLWAIMGGMLRRLFTQSAARRWIDRCLGLSLVLTAIFLSVPAFAHCLR